MEKLKSVKKNRGHARSIQVAALNITTHPHSAQGYLDLLSASHKLRRPVKIHGKHYASFGRFVPLTDDPLDGVTGEIHKYFNLNVEGKWFNVEDLAIAKDSDTSEIRIPGHLKPDFEAFRYVFFPRSHRLFYEVRAYRVSSLAPRQVERLLKDLFETPSIQRRFGNVDVVVEPEADSIGKIFNMHRLRRLQIEVTRPNQDELSRAEREVFRRLDEEFAVRETTTLYAQQGRSLRPSPETRLLSQVAASNGRVLAEGTNENNRAVRVSTENHPWVETQEYHPSVSDERDVFVEKAKKMLARLRLRLRTVP